MKKNIFAISIIFCLLALVSCVSSGKSGSISRNLTDGGIKTETQLYNFFISENPDADKKAVARLVSFYVDEAAQEGINSDCAFAQMCLETGFLKFGNLVTAEMHNYCGLGAIDSSHPGESFATERLGVRAHIQHLHAYATTEDVPLKNSCVDPRYKYVTPRGKSPTIEGLAGTWAADKKYAEKIDSILERMEEF